jgi:hypothetical protein
MLFTDMPNPLTGAPGAVLLYAIIGLFVWPTDRPGGLLGLGGARRTWAVLWLATGGMWLLGENSAANATHDAIQAAPSGMRWLSSLQHSAAGSANGNGVAIAIALAILSAAVGIAVGANWRPKPFIALAVAINLAYWVLGQGLGGIFTGTGTDPNSAPLFILLALGLYSLTPIRQPPASRSPRAVSPRQIETALSRLARAESSAAARGSKGVGAQSTAACVRVADR